MASRLSEESFPAIYDSGCSGLAFNPNGLDLGHIWGRVDFDAVLASPDPAAAIASLSSQQLYYSLLEKGPGDCLEVLAHVSAPQFLRILDYDAWRGGEFLPQRVLYWFDLLRKIGPEKAYEQFRDLEEEYQLSVLAPFVKIYDQDAYEQMTDVDQDSLFRLPADAMFYSIESTDTDIREGIHELMECILGNDMNYALSLLAHAAYMPPNESVHLIEQFRTARLEEDGFVSYEESLSTFAELDPAQHKMKWQALAHHFQDALTFSSSQDTALFLDEVLFYGSAQLWSEDLNNTIHQSFVSLANRICAAVRIEVDDLSTLKFVFANAKALCSLGLEYLADGDLKNGAKILGSEYAMDLFRVGLSLLRQQQRKFVNALCDSAIPDAESMRKYFVLQKYALMIDWLDNNLRDRIGFEQTETLKGIFNRFPQYPKAITEADEPNRIRFFPVAKISDLRFVEEIINRMILCFQIKK